MSQYILGIEIGGTKQQLALGDNRGEICAREQGVISPKEGASGIRRWLEKAIPEFIECARQQFGPVAAVGCGFGGPINTPAGKVLRSIQIQGWSDFPIKSWLEERSGLPAIVANDSNAAAWGEYRRGIGRGSQNFFYTNMGSGVGGGFIFNGALFDGQGLGAGEFGHTYVPDWTREEPGRAEKVENLCSGWAIEDRLRRPGYLPKTSLLFDRFQGNIESLTAKDLAQAAQDGDAFALQELNGIAYSMGLGLVNVLSLTNVERIAIGGGVSKMGDILIDRIREVVAQYAFISSRGKYTIHQCELGDAIVLVGAILIARDAFGLGADEGGQ
jgi:glucokinase